ncbi:hypothetical protein ACMFMG_004177 [Clarireedia jacksonii]
MMDGSSSGTATPTSSFFDIPAGHNESGNYSSTLKRSSYLTDDPTTIEGQRPGATLTVKRATISGKGVAAVGDIVLVKKHLSIDSVLVKNLRTCLVGVLNWQALLAVPYHGSCDCSVDSCRCIYETFEEFHHRCARIAVGVKNNAHVENEPAASKMTSTEKQKAVSGEVADPLTLAG